MTGVLIRRGKFEHRHAWRENNVRTQKKEDRVTIKAEIGVVLPQARGHPSFLAATRS